MVRAVSKFCLLEKSLFELQGLSVLVSDYYNLVGTWKFGWCS